MDLGIMQGRIYPHSLKKLQLFPRYKWEKELDAAKAIGFKNFELLFDKELYCRSILDKKLNQEKLNLIGDLNKELSVKSINIDYFCTLKTFDEHKLDFLNMLNEIINLIKGTSVKILVIPYCDENNLKDIDDLHKVLELFKESKIDEMMISNNLSLSLELGLSAKNIKEVFNNFSFKNIGICYDLGNAAGSGFKPEKEILLLNNLINHVHIKDKPLNGSNVMLGNGDVNFAKCIKSLHKVNFNGCLILETIYSKSPLEEVSQNYNFIKNVLYPL
tara:strand:+ start:5703 stop:6524 length:822 start_codon:yes stop_codon:yes gene_type:complete